MAPQREAKTSVRRGTRRWAPVSETACRNVPSGCGLSLISEPAGGAHEDYDEAARLLKAKLVSTLDELGGMSTNELLQARYSKFRKMGNFFTGG